MPISVMNARGELTFKSDGDAPRLALGCKSQILVSLRLFGMERHYLPIQVSLSIVHKKNLQKMPTLITQKSPLPVSLSLSHTCIGLL